MITIGSNLEGQSQTIKDTICVDVPKLKKIYAAAAQKRVADSLLFICEKQVSELKINISLLEERDSETRNNYNRQIENLNHQIQLHKDQVIGYEALIKKMKRQKRLAIGVGIVTTGAAIYLSTLK